MRWLSQYPDMKNVEEEFSLFFIASPLNLYGSSNNMLDNNILRYLMMFFSFYLLCPKHFLFYWSFIQNMREWLLWKSILTSMDQHDTQFNSTNSYNFLLCHKSGWYHLKINRDRENKYNKLLVIFDLHKVFSLMQFEIMNEKLLGE